MQSRTRPGTFLTTTLTTLATGTLVALTLVAAPPTTAAGETCRGEAATIVGKKYADLKGTPARDVVVTNGANSVATYGGDDLICITGEPLTDGGSTTIEVYAGAGNDIVDGTTAIGWGVEGELGSGADTFYGGSGYDRIYAGAGSYSKGDILGDTEVDVMITGAGDDDIISGDSGQPNADVIDAGADRDSIDYYGLRSGGGVVQGGDDLDWLSVEITAGETTIDATTGRMTHPSAIPMEWTGIEFYDIDGTGDLTFTGTPGDDYLDFRAVGRLRAAMGDGNDQVMPLAAPGPGSDIQGGAGRDSFVTGTRTGYLGLDMNTGLLTVGATAPYVIPAGGIEETHLMAKRVDLTGNNEANLLRVLSCGGTVKGGAGDDTMEFAADGDYETYEFRCRKRQISWFGEAGMDTIKGSSGRDRIDGGDDADRMFGRAGNDYLYGGSGLDLAKGGSGRDRCSAEQRTSCERR